MKKIITKNILALILVGLFAIPSVSSASNLSSVTESLNASTNQLIEAKDGSAANVLSEEEDINYRKKVVSDAIALSFKEIESTRKKLSSIELDDESDSNKIRLLIIEWLDAQEKYFHEAEDKLSAKNLSLDDVKNIAREIKTYRDENYNNDLISALNFILALETSRLTNVSADRWNKISSDLAKIEGAGLIKKDQFLSEMTEAKKMIDGSRSLSDKALIIIKDLYLPPIEEDSEEDLTQEETEKIDEAPIEAKKEKTPSARELCEAAIINLKSAYGEFVKISASLKKLLKLP